MGKRTVRLTESDLHNIIKESVNKVLNEIGDTPMGMFDEIPTEEFDKYLSAYEYKRREEDYNKRKL